MVTTTLEQYESLAIQLAKNPKELKSIKEKLLNNLPYSSLYDTALYVQHLESAYLKMYERLKKDLNPDHIYVEQ